MIKDDEDHSGDYIDQYNKDEVFQVTKRAVIIFAVILVFLMVVL